MVQGKKQYGGPRPVRPRVIVSIGSSRTCTDVRDPAEVGVAVYNMVRNGFTQQLSVMRRGYTGRPHQISLYSLTGV